MFRQKRSLGKNISQSRRVNKLSDIGALLYTWMIPHFDDEGRMDGDPEDVHFHVMPRRNISNEAFINELLYMDELGLITWYVIDGHPCIQMNPEAWEEHQSFKGIKRQASKIPAYDPSAHQKYKDFYNDSTSEGVPLHPEGCTTPPEGVDMSTGGDPQEKLREEKLDNSFSSYEEKQPSAADDSQHFSHKIDAKYLPATLSLCKRLQEKSNGSKDFNPYEWLQKQVKNKEPPHPGAMIKALTSLLNNWRTTRKPWGYLKDIVEIENGNFHEKDRIQEWNHFEKELAVFLQSPEGKRLTQLIELSGMLREL